MATNYQRGRDFEYRVANRLRDDGYFVIRSAGSHSPVDLVAWKDGKALFIQCGLGRKSKAERMVLVDLAADCKATPVLVEKGMKFTWLSEAA